jgi:hypothetical protein
MLPRSASIPGRPTWAPVVVLALLAVGCAATAPPPPPAVVVPDLRGTWTGTWGGTPLTLLVTDQQSGPGDSGLVIGPWQVLGEPYPTVTGVLTSSVRGESVSTRMDGLVGDAGGGVVVSVRARSRAGEQRLTLRLVNPDRLEGSGDSQYDWGPQGPVQLARHARPRASSRLGRPAGRVLIESRARANRETRWPGSTSTT